MLIAIGVTAVASILAITITSSALYAVGYTTSTRAAVQSQASAEAGIDYAAAKIATGVCQPTYISALEPSFSVTVASSTLASSATGDVDTSWVTGCPTSVSVQRIKLVSTGTAASFGLAGNSAGNTRKVEAVYPYVATPPTWLTGTGAAIYSFNQSDPTINNLTLNTTPATPATIQYLSGSMSCTSSSVINGSVILGAGGASLASGCTINGDLFASGTVSLQNATITGNASADNGTYPSVSLSNSATVQGNVFGAGPVLVQGAVGGNVVAGPAGGITRITGSVGGSVVVAGTVNNTGAVTGTITSNRTGIVAPTIPFVPGWVDYPYAPSDWVGYTEYVMTDCSNAGFTAALTAVLNSPTPRVLNALACGSAGLDFDLVPANSQLKSDLAIIANKFELRDNAFNSNDTTERKLWFIIPDRGVGGAGVINHLPDCPSGGGVKMTNNVTVGPHVSALIYSPCLITNSADTWRGQIYAVGTKTANAFTLTYSPIGIPGVDLSTGTNTTTLPGTGVLGGRSAVRNIRVN